MNYRALALLVIFLTTPLLASADVVTGLRSGIELATTPENPTPGQSVVVQANVIGAQASTVAFRWEVGGVVVAEGVGTDRITLEAPPLGKAISVVVSASKDGAGIGNASLIVRPAEVTLVWEASSSRPPFYIGRTLATANSPVTLNAIPSILSGGSAVAANNLAFTWTVNGKNTSSGVGKNSIRVTPPFYNSPFVVGVTASTLDHSIVAQSSVQITPQSPGVVIYEESPLAGLMDERAATGSYTFATDEVSFRAFPLYATDVTGVTSAWTLNNTAVAVDPADPFAVVFKKTAAGNGTYTVGFSFSNARLFLEKASASFLLTF